MRTIKFRAWDERNNEMRYSDIHDGEFYLNTKGVLYMYAIPKSESELETKYYKNYNVMQFTGLTDKNGKEIYEGDIISWGEPYSNEVVIFESGSFGYKKAEFCNLRDEFFITENKFLFSAVIGNIHENSELLK